MMNKIFTPHFEGIFIKQCPNWGKRRISLWLSHCWNYVPQLWTAFFNICVYISMKEKKKYPDFILEPICPHVENTRVSGQGSMNSNIALNGHKMSGQSILQLPFSSPFLILVLSHLWVHSLGFLSSSSPSGKQLFCLSAQAPVQLRFATAPAFPDSQGKHQAPLLCWERIPGEMVCGYLV